MMKQAVNSISDDEEVMLGDYEYPLVTLDNLDLPIVFRHSRWQSAVTFLIASLLALGFAFLLAVIIRHTILMHHISGLSWIGIISVGLMFTFSAVTAWIHAIRLTTPIYLTIDKQKIIYQTHRLRPTLTVINYDRLYWAATMLASQRHGEYLNVIYYVTLSQDDLVYQKHRQIVALPFLRDKQKMLEMTGIIRALMTHYHKAHAITQIPRIKLIKQR